MKKTLLLLAVFLAHVACLSAQTSLLSGLTFTTSRAQFDPGDSITIQEVFASSPQLAPGDTVRVRGTYTLQSRPTATLGLSLTSNVPLGPVPVQATSRVTINAGTGTFDLVHAIQATGTMHVTFTGTGASFGGIYFAGTAVIPGVTATATPGTPSTPSTPTVPTTPTTPTNPSTINTAGLTSVPFVTSRAQFSSGDLITIREVLSTSPALAAGDRVVVRGDFQLQSRPQAMLMVSLTINIPGVHTLVAPTSHRDVTTTSGTFELEYNIVQPGALHVSFYPLRESGSSFGGVYFSRPGSANPGQAAVAAIVNPVTNVGRLANLSTRGLVAPGEGALVAGLNVTDRERYVLIRAIGPSLSAFGVGNALRRPIITLHDANGQVVASASSWSTSLSADQRAAIQLLNTSVGAFPLPAGSDDAVLHLRLVSGAYTVVISSGDNQTGIALAEVYASPTLSMQ